MALVLVGGGARSGKSRFALRYVEERCGGGLFLATAEQRDHEMRERVARHREERGPLWSTREEPLDLAGALAEEASSERAIVVDCLTLWLSNVLLSQAHDEEVEIESLAGLLAEWSGPTLVLVANEVGLGIVPDNALARRFRDLAGGLNQRVAEAADQVWWMAFGCPLQLKPGGER